jgi:hypothetical protein
MRSQYDELGGTFKFYGKQILAAALMFIKHIHPGRVIYLWKQERASIDASCGELFYKLLVDKHWVYNGMEIYAKVSS